MCKAAESSRGPKDLNPTPKFLSQQEVKFGPGFEISIKELLKVDPN